LRATTENKWSVVQYAGEDSSQAVTKGNAVGNRSESGEWMSALAEVDGVELMATRFLGLRENLFVSSCSTDLAGRLQGALSTMATYLVRR